MLEKIEGIVTDIVKHSDKHNVVTLYTLTRGRMAFLVPLSSSRSGKLRNASIQPMAIISAEINLKEGKEFYTLRQMQKIRLWHSIYSHPVKSSILFFLTEFTNRLTRLYPPDALLWNYLYSSLQILEEADGRSISNFHISFLIRLLSIVGIEPSSTSWQPGDLFDMMSGEMITKDLIGFGGRRVLLSEEESRHVPLLLRINFFNMGRFKILNEHKRRILERIIAYYSLHLSMSSDFKTLPVLQEFFA